MKPPSDNFQLFQLAPDYVLGTIGADDKLRMERALAQSAALRREVDNTAEAFAAAAAALPPVAGPPAEVRARLLNALEGPERFRPFFAELCRMLALPLETVRATLARIDGAAGWTTIRPGISLLRFAAGATLEGAEAALLRVAPGVSFPRHEHLGQELALVLEGGGHDEGHAYTPGALVEHAAGSAHTFVAARDRDLVLVVLHRGVKFH